MPALRIDALFHRMPFLFFEIRDDCKPTQITRDLQIRPRLLISFQSWQLEMLVKAYCMSYPKCESKHPHLVKLFALGGDSERARFDKFL